MGRYSLRRVHLHGSVGHVDLQQHMQHHLALHRRRGRSPSKHGQTPDSLDRVPYQETCSGVSLTWREGDRRRPVYKRRALLFLPAQLPFHSFSFHYVSVFSPTNENTVKTPRVLTVAFLPGVCRHPSPVPGRSESRSRGQEVWRGYRYR